VNEDVNASPLAPHLRQDSAFPDVWHVDLVEWEQRGSASAAAGEVLLELDGSEPMWPDVTRRRAMLARLHALVFERAGAQAANEQTRRLVGLLGVLELYVILSPLEALFRHPEPAVRIAVLQALGRFMYKRSFVTVRTALRDEDGTVQQEARRALESLRFPHAFDPLARIYRESTNEHDRAAALTALGRIDTREAAELLVDVFQFDGPTERAAAATALSRARGRTFFQVAREALPNVSGDARTAISDVFASRGETI